MADLNVRKIKESYGQLAFSWKSSAYLGFYEYRAGWEISTVMSRCCQISCSVTLLKLPYLLSIMEWQN